MSLNQLLNTYIPLCGLAEILIVFYFVCYLTTFMHELFHFLVARHYGFNINKFYVGSGLTLYDKGIVHFGFNPFTAYVDWKPSESQKQSPIYNKQVASVFAAGVFGNLVCLFFGISVFQPAEIWSFMLIVLGVLLIITNLIPIKVGKLTTDGGMIIKALTYQFKNLGPLPE